MLSNLSTELVLQVYNNLNSVSDVINLSLVCQRFHALLPASRKLSTLFKAADREFGPAHDAIQVVVLQSQNPHNDQNPPLSFSLLRQIISVGRVAQKYEKLYPELKWRENFLDRRSLTTEERYRLRRSIYRLWRYSAAFHTPAYPRTTRMLHLSLEKRMMLFRFPTDELLELEDTRRITQEIVSSSIVPSNSDVQDKFSDRWQTKDVIHILNPRPSAFDGLFHRFDARKHDTRKDLFSAEGWGDEISHYYIVQDMLKLDPGQVMWLKENAPCKWQVEAFLQELGEWFYNNGETVAQTLHMVLLARGHEELLDGLETGEFGVSGRRTGGGLVC